MSRPKKRCKCCFDELPPNDHKATCNKCQQLRRRFHYSYSRICSEALERVSDNTQQELILAARDVYLKQEAIAAKLAESFKPMYHKHLTGKTAKNGEPVYVKKLTGYKCAGCHGTMAKPRCIKCEQEATCNQ